MSVKQNNKKLSNTIKICPNEIVQAISNCLYGDIQEDYNLNKKFEPKSNLIIFDEEYYIKKYPSKFNESKKKILRKLPTEKEINQFINSLSQVLMFSESDIISAYIYMTRIINKNNYPMLPTTWRLFLLISMHISKKCLNEGIHTIFNKETQELYPFVSKKEFIALELEFLMALDYRIRIKDSIYTNVLLEVLSFCINKLPDKRSRSLMNIC